MVRSTIIRMSVMCTSTPGSRFDRVTPLAGISHSRGRLLGSRVPTELLGFTGTGALPAQLGIQVEQDLQLCVVALCFRCVQYGNHPLPVRSCVEVRKRSGVGQPLRGPHSRIKGLKRVASYLGGSDRECFVLLSEKDFVAVIRPPWTPPSFR